MLGLLAKAVKTELGADGQHRCRFDPVFKLEVGTKMIVASPPGRHGWKAKLPPAAINNPPQCASKSEVTTTLRGDPDDASYRKLIRDSELEHVESIKRLYASHLVPYYQFVMGLRSTAASVANCPNRLNQQLGKRAEQAAFGFALGDAAETKRFDDPSSTHHGKLTPVIDPNCKSVTLTSKQSHPQQQGREPGNVKMIAPVVTKVDPLHLSVAGTDLLSNGRLVHSFSTQDNATTAMGMLSVHNITEIKRIGSFQIALSNGVAPILSIAGISELEFDPTLIQVSIGLPNPNDWVISQVKGDQFFEIEKFTSPPAQAYSAT